MDHHPDCIQGFGCHCLVNEPAATAPIAGARVRSVRPGAFRIGALAQWVVWLLRWP